MKNSYEHFLSGVGIANDTNLSDTKKKTLNSLTDHMFKEETVQESINKLIKTTIQKTIANNASNLQAILQQTNTIMIDATGLKEGCLVEGPVIVKNVSQRNIGDVKIVKNSYNKTMTDIQSDIKRNINYNFIEASKFSDINRVGSVFGDMAKAAIGVVGEVSGDIAGVLQNAGGGSGIANKYDNKRVNENNKTLVTNGTLEALAEINQEDMEDLSLTDELSLENIETIVTDILAKNGIMFRGLCPTNVEITDIEQINETTLSVESETVNQISRTIGDNYLKNLDYVYNKMLEKTRDETKGDVAQLGVAAAVTISAGGEALSQTIDSTGKAVERSFLGLGSIVSQPVKYFIIGLIAVAVIIMVLCIVAPSVCKSFFKSRSKRPSIRARAPRSKQGFFSRIFRPKRSAFPGKQYVRQKLPSKEWCETGILKPGEYDQTIHNLGKTPSQRCAEYYPEYNKISQSPPGIANPPRGPPPPYKP